MQTMFILAMVVFGAVAGVARGEDPCTEEMFFGIKCCDLDDTHAVYEQELFEKCKQKHFQGNPPKGSREMDIARGCIVECVVSEKGLLTPDHKLDQVALTDFLTPFEPVFRPIVHANIDKCLASYEARVDDSLDCTSGAYEFHNCFFRENFLNCPSSRWTSSPECEQMKNDVLQCPKTPVMMLGKKMFDAKRF